MTASKGNLIIGGLLLAVALIAIFVFGLGNFFVGSLGMGGISLGGLSGMPGIMFWVGLVLTFGLIGLGGLSLVTKGKGLPLVLIGALVGLLTFTQIGTNIVGGLESFTGGGSRANSVVAPVGDYSQPIRVTGDKCIFAWDEKPDEATFTAQVRGVNNKTWFDWEDRPSKFAWIRFRSLGSSSITVSYEFRKPGECS